MGQVSRALDREARSLLAADLEISGLRPLSLAERGDLIAEAGQGSRVQSNATFLSVLAPAQNQKIRRSRLCQVSAVEASYPFYGNLRIRLQDGRISEDAVLLNGSEPLVFVQQELLLQFGIELGARLRLGKGVFRVAGLIIEEPGLGGGAFSLGPKVLIGRRHLDSTGLTRFGSRVTYNTLVAMPRPEDAPDLAKRLRGRWGLKGEDKTFNPMAPADSLRLRSSKDAENNLKRFFERLADFLNLASLMALMLGGIGIASVVRLFIREQAPSIGVLRTVGAGSLRIGRIYLFQALGLGLAGSLLGALLGTAAQNMVPLLLADFFPVALSFGIDLKACLTGLGLGMLCCLLFSLLPLSEIRKSSPAELFRDEATKGGLGLDFWMIAGLGSLVFLGLGWAEARSFQRGAGFVAALILGAALIAFFATGLLPILAAVRPQNFGLRHGLSNLARPGLRPAASVIALGCAALQLGVLALYQNSLLAELDPGKRPAEIPGLFMIDVQSDQVGPLEAWLKTQKGLEIRFSPMVKGRYRGKNGALEKSAEAWSREQEDAREMRDREQNLSYREALSPGERVVAGQWMDPQGDTLEASLEEWFAKRLGVGVGDSVRFDVQGVSVEARVTSLRKVHWASFQPNFFILLSPWALKDAPQTWIGSIAGAGERQRQTLQTDLVEKFPNVTVIDVAEGSRKIMGIMKKISWAIRSVGFFSLLTGLAVLAGIALSTARARRREVALIKTLGAGRTTILVALGAEFGALGVLSAGLGILLSLLFAWILLEKVLEIPFRVPALELVLLGASLSLLAAVIGIAASYSALRVKPLAVLREE